MRMKGFTAWMAWLFIHLLYLVEFQDRVLVFFRWIWAYFTWTWGVRLILATPPSEHPADKVTSSRPEQENTVEIEAVTVGKDQSEM